MLAALDPALLDLAMLFGLCAAVAIAFHRLKLPALAGFLAVGAVAGPHCLGLVHEKDLVQSLAEMGVVLLLFTVGLELSWKQIVRLRRAVVVGGGLQVLGTVALGALVSHFSGLSWRASVFLGFLLTHSSTTAITKLLSDRRELNSPPGRLAVAIAIGQDIAVVPMILVLPLLENGNTELGTLVVEMAKSLGSFAAIGVIAHYLAPMALDLAAKTRSREIFLLTVFTLFLMVAMATAWFGMSLALGAFLAGLVLAETEHHYQVRGEIEPLRDALGSLFFVSIGMLFDPSAVAEAPVVVCAALFAVVVGKTLVVMPIARLLGYPTEIAVRSALLLAQVGEFSFVLVQLVRGRNVLPEQLERIFLVVAALSIAITPALSAAGRTFARRKRPDERRTDGDREVADHVVLVGYGGTGQAVARALAAQQIPFVAIDVHAQLASVARLQQARFLVGDATRSQVLEAAGLSRARLLVIAIDDADAARRTAALARRIAPQVRMVVRAGYLSEVAVLMDLGVRQIVPMELEASIEVMVRALRCYLVPDDEVGRQVKALRSFAFGIDKTARPALVAGESLNELLPELALEIVRIEPGSELDGKTLVSAALPARTGCSVVAVRRGRHVLVNIGPDTTLACEDVVVLLGPSGKIAAAAALVRAPLPVPV